MRQLIAATIVGIALAAALPVAASGQQAGSTGDPGTGAAVTAPAPAVPAPPARAAADTAIRGPVLPAHVPSAVERVLRDETPTPAASDNIVIPVTTAVIVLAVVVLILLID